MPESTPASLFNSVVVPPRVAVGGAGASKQYLRDTLYHRRRVIPADLSNTTAWKAANHLRTLLGQLGPSAVALYVPRGSEVNIMPLVEDLWQWQQTVCLPRVISRGYPLAFNVWAQGEKLGHDALGIPAADGPEIIPAVIVMPMLGYSRGGYRLGSGGGYYDLTLSHLKQPVITVGVCHTELEVSDFPAEPHDHRLNHIVTGREIIHCL